MNSQLVNKEIRKHIWQALKKNGFSEFTSRSAWRYRDSRIEVVNFQSFNSYQASSNFTTFSFIINLGIYLSYMPEHPSTKRKNDKLVPKEMECHLRKTLKKNFLQKEGPRDIIWYIDRTGANLNDIIANALKVILEVGLPWFDEFSNNKNVFDFLKNGTESEEGTFGIGNNPSPCRYFLLGFTASELGDAKTTKSALEYVIQSDCYWYFNEHMQAKINSLDD